MISLHTNHIIATPTAQQRPTSAPKVNAEPDPAETQLLNQLAARDREVRTHEQAHLAAAGGLAHGGPSFTFTRGPDGRQYATGGEVSIDVAPVANDPQATLQKAQQIRRAALAPANPSQADRAVAARAMAMATEARVELQREAHATDDHAVASTAPTTKESQLNSGYSDLTEPHPHEIDTAV